MSETYIKAILDKDASMQECIHLVNELKSSQLIQSVDVETKAENSSEILFKPSTPRKWNDNRIDKEDLQNKFSIIRKVIYDTIDLMVDLEVNTRDLSQELDFQTLEKIDYFMTDVKDIEINFESVSKLFHTCKDKVITDLVNIDFNESL